MLSPIFSISDIQITGNNRISSDSILESSGLIEPVNIFIFNRGKAEKELAKNLYLQDVSFEKIYPSTLAIKVLERQIIGYIPYLDSYLCIDENGMVLDVSASIDEALPLIDGLRFSTFTLGEHLAVENKEAFNIIMTLANLFDKYDLQEEFINKVDVNDVNDIHLHIYNIDVAFGLISDADEKIRTLKAIIQDTLPDSRSVRGTLDVRVIGKQYILKVLT
ncbi:MAG: FtsQ-type POTRA domain-containing protein [Clostridiales bacterium]|nr:FtsQ-type POTRA domain-containing protein [Clostridiales bacterium]